MDVGKRDEFLSTSSADYAAALARVRLAEHLRGGRRSIPADDPAALACTNDDRSAVEVYEFQHHDAGREGCFAYLFGSPPPRYLGTWLGHRLADVTWLGQPYRDGFGGLRQNLHATGIDGHSYYGTYFLSSGDYCRLRRRKRSKV